MFPNSSDLPSALVVKAALLAAERGCFDDIVVENDRGTIILSGALPDLGLAYEAASIAEEASGALVVNNIVVAPTAH